MKDKVGIGIIGTGFARKVQIPSFAACEKAEIVSVASGSFENAESTAKEFGIGHFTADWRETVAHQDVDLVCITTPPNLHLEMTIAAIGAGKHILCEKPMAMNVAEAEEMTRRAESTGRLALIDHELRFQPGRQLAFEMLRAGEIGKVRHAKYFFRAPHRGDVNLPWNWWSDAAQGGGALGAVNSHLIDACRWFLGTEISKVFCQLQSHVKQRRDHDGTLRDVTTDDEANMILRFADSELTSDATALVSVSMTELPDYKNSIEFYGTGGVMRIEHRGEIFIAKKEGEWEEIPVDTGSAVGGVADTGFSRGFMTFAPQIVEAILNGETFIKHAATFEDGLKVQNILDAARKSDQNGCIITI